MEHFDILVYGATPSGIAASLAASREGATVALVQEDHHIGGLTSGGLSHTDFITFESLGGIWREFMLRIEAHYIQNHGSNSQQVKDCFRGAYYEPSAARQVFESMLAEESGITVFTNARLVSLKTTAVASNPKLEAAQFSVQTNAELLEIQAHAFIDATYEGDLMALSGASFRLGCESSSEFGESLAPAEANPFIMATNFRVCLSSNPANSLPIPKPANYDRNNYLKVIELVRSGFIQPSLFGGTDWPLAQLILVRPLPNSKADFNDRWGSPVSIKLIEETHDWPQADAVERKRLFNMAKDKTLGLLWFLGNDLDLPEWIRDGMNKWGIPADEYQDSQNWSPALYIREGRRLEGCHVFAQQDGEQDAGQIRSKWHANSIAIADYGFNSHGTHRLADGTIGGTIGKKVPPMQIPFSTLVPKRVRGLLVPVALSSTHVGYSALRMEPTWTALGQAAGIAAALSVRSNTEIQDLDVATIQHKLHAVGAKTIYVSDIEENSSFFRAVQWFGTRYGFLHDLQPSSSEKSQELLTPRAQWMTAFPHHAFEPNQMLDQTLRRTWIDSLYGCETAARKISICSRGEFINQLFEHAAKNL